MPATHWDFVLTCFEPVVAVTGGIGTYTRMLLQHLDTVQIDGRPARILFFTAALNRKVDSELALKNVCTEYVETRAEIENAPVNNLRDPFLHYSFNVMRRMQELAAKGATFGLLEFPDYNAEGYFPLKAIEHGLLRVGQTAVRLHSPTLMLNEDNAYTSEPSVMRARFEAAERYAYRRSDLILFGGDAMRDRVASLLPEGERQEFLRKCVKVPHPWPEGLARARRGGERNRTLDIAYLGRLEYRKGVDLLVRAAVGILDRVPSVRFHLFGRDTLSWNGSSVQAHLESLIPSAVRDRFEFHGYVPQERLRDEFLPRMDGFVFPSRFENYPNALLEVLGLGVPILVSSAGCMPEIGREFSFVQAGDPEDPEAMESGLIDLIGAAAEQREHQPYGVIRQKMNAWMVEEYRRLIATTPEAPELESSDSLPSISIVVPHFQHSLWLPRLLDSIRPQLRPGDEVIVVDDGSAPLHVEGSRGFIEAFGARFLTTGGGAGPSVARNIGAAAATGDLLYFVDADDELQPDSVDALRKAFVRNPRLDVASGWMRVFGDENHVWASYDPLPETILLENSSHAGIVIRRSSFETSAGYSERLRYHFEDWEFHARLALNGYTFEVLPLLTYRYRVNRRSGRSVSNVARLQRSYETLLQTALSGIRPDRLPLIWPVIQKLLASLLIMRDRNPQQEQAGVRELRYRLADAVNGAIKGTAVHSSLKSVFEAALDLTGSE